MTVASFIKPLRYLGDDSTDTYPWGFATSVIEEADLYVVQSNVATGVETKLTVGIDFSVTGIGNRNGGSVILTAGNLATGQGLSIRPVLKITQKADLKNQGSSFPETQEKAMDRLALIAQQQQNEIDRSIKISSTDDPDDYSLIIPVAAERASTIFGFDVSGNIKLYVDSAASAVEAEASKIAAAASAVEAAGFAGAGTGDFDIPVSTTSTLLVGSMAVFNGVVVANASLGVTGTLYLDRGEDIASATSIFLGVDGNLVNVTGSATIDSLGHAGIGTSIKVRFTGSPVLSHHATDLILPNSKNLNVTPGSVGVFVNYDNARWFLAEYTPGNKYPGYEDDGLTVGLAGSAATFGYGATYVRDGRMAHFTIDLGMTSLGGETIDPIILTGLPHPSRSTVRQAVTVARPRNMAISAGHSLSGYINPLSSQINIEVSDVTTGATPLTHTEMGASGEMIVSGSYKIQ